MDDAAKTIQDKLQQISRQVSTTVDQGIKSVSTTLSASAVSAQDEANKLLDKSKELSSAVSDEAKALESTAITQLRASTAGATAVALVAFGPTRRMLYRLTLARFRSEEGMYRAAELRLKSLQDAMQQSSMETKKLEERLGAAHQEYTRGLAKLKGTGQQLVALSKGLRATERTTHELLADLRQLPSKAALQLRSDAAAVAASAKQQRSAVERHVNALLKQGMV